MTKRNQMVSCNPKFKGKYPKEKCTGGFPFNCECLRVDVRYFSFVIYVDKEPLLQFFGEIRSQYHVCQFGRCTRSNIPCRTCTTTNWSMSGPLSTKVDAIDLTVSCRLYASFHTIYTRMGKEFRLTTFGYRVGVESF